MLKHVESVFNAFLKELLVVKQFILLFEFEGILLVKLSTVDVSLQLNFLLKNSFQFIHCPKVLLPVRLDVLFQIVQDTLLPFFEVFLFVERFVVLALPKFVLLVHLVFVLLVKYVHFVRDIFGRSLQLFFNLFLVVTQYF